MPQVGCCRLYWLPKGGRMTNTTNQPGEEELDALLWKLQCDTIDEYKRHAAPVYKPLRDEAIEAIAAHQTAHTDAVVKKLESEKDLTQYADNMTHHKNYQEGQNRALDTAIAL